MENTLAGRIKEIRDYYNLTQGLFGESLGVSHAHISKIENDINKPSETLVMLICLKYQVSEDWLLNGTGNMTINRNNEDDHCPDCKELMEKVRVLEKKIEYSRQQLKVMLSQLD